MKKTAKVILLSLFVFPGLGHLFLKKYAVALAFIASGLYLLLSLINGIIDKSQQVVDSLLKGEIPLEIVAIRQALEEHGVLEEPQQVTVIYLFLFIWVLAAFDAYRIAKMKKDN
jgi:hypothetical protein